MGYLDKLFGISFLFFSMLTFSQNKSVIINYEEIGKIQDKEKTIIETVLIHNLNESVYIIDEKEIKSTTEKSGGEKVHTVTKIPFQLYYKNYKKDTLTIQIGKVNSISILSKIEKYKWKLARGSKKIGNLYCKKAIAKTKDGETIAWYTEELGIFGGPKKYDNLPGIILYLEDKFTIYKANKIKIVNEKSILPKRDEHTKFITEKALKKGITTTVKK